MSARRTAAAKVPRNSRLFNDLPAPRAVHILLVALGDAAGRHVAGMDEDADALLDRRPLDEDERLPAHRIGAARAEAAVLAGQPFVVLAVRPLEDGDALGLAVEGIRVIDPAGDLEVGLLLAAGARIGEEDAAVRPAELRVEAEERPGVVDLVAHDRDVAVARNELLGDVEQIFAAAEREDDRAADLVEDGNGVVHLPDEALDDLGPVPLRFAAVEGDVADMVLERRLVDRVALFDPGVEAVVDADVAAAVELDRVGEPERAVVGIRIGVLDEEVAARRSVERPDVGEIEGRSRSGRRTPRGRRCRTVRAPALSSRFGVVSRGVRA